MKATVEEFIQFLSTPSARRATQRGGLRAGGGCISIHALCEEGDACIPGVKRPGRNFYPRPLRGGRRAATKGGGQAMLFLSTPSARRATEPVPPEALAQEISIHALCEEGDLLLGRRLLLGRISIHALCEEGDLTLAGDAPAEAIFLSTPSARRATSSSRAASSIGTNFYPRPLRGGRLRARRFPPFGVRFLSTPSARRATSQCYGQHDTSKYFYPRPLRGGRPYPSRTTTPSFSISIHALCEEGD